MYQNSIEESACGSNIKGKKKPLPMQMVASESGGLCVQLTTPTSSHEITQLFKLLWKKGAVEDLGKLTQRVSSRIFAPFNKRSEIDACHLSDECIDWGFKSIAKRHWAQKVVSISSLVGGKNSKAFIQSVTQNGKSKRSRQNLKNAKLIFWPQCWGKHWYLLVIKIEENKCFLHCLDGKGNTDFHPSLLQLGLELIQAVYDDIAFPLPIVTKSLLGPRQNNEFDCGPYIWFYAEQFCQGVDLTIYEQYASILCGYGLARIQMTRYILADPSIDLFFMYRPSGSPLLKASPAPSSPEKMELEPPSPKKARLEDSPQKSSQDPTPRSTRVKKRLF